MSVVYVVASEYLMMLVIVMALHILMNAVYVVVIIQHVLIVKE